MQIFLKIGILKSFTNFTGKHLCWSLFLKNLQAEGLQLHIKRIQHRCFPVKFAKFLRTPFSFRTPSETASASPVAASVFFKVLFNSYFATLLWRTNNFFFSTLRLMYKKTNSFVYKFVVNCRVFWITPLGGIHCKAENWHSWSYEQYFSKHRFLDICRYTFNLKSFQCHLWASITAVFSNGYLKIAAYNFLELFSFKFSELIRMALFSNIYKHLQKQSPRGVL